ncbi:MAG: hypothetical protein OEW60_05475 [Thiovulaceae bacterium]|nr:hypothetical protein [Sulfurimonadaceae bacterium]
MQWKELCDFHQNSAYHVSLDKYASCNLVKYKTPLFRETPVKIRWTYYSYIVIIYLLRIMSIVALPVSFYYEMGDWWYGLFGWIISDYLYYELRKIISEDLLSYSLSNEDYYQSLQNYADKENKELFSVQKKSQMKPTPWYKKIVEIFFK